jgi:type I restriction enzyme, R subunit
VTVHWGQYLAKLEDEFADSTLGERDAIEAKIADMRRMDMAVVVSQGQNEVTELAKKGLDIRPHRKRMIEENLDEKFKDANDPLRLVFVCAMWITGFDVPSCSTIYLDKPMRNHTLMQTIARANRRFPGKEAGLIVDYAGVFRNLQKALAIYGGPRDGTAGDTPIKDKAALVEHLKYMIAEGLAFCLLHGVDAEAIKKAKGFDRVGALDDAVEALIATDDTKKAFLNVAITVARIYRAVLPDPVASQVAPDAVLLSVLAAKIRALTPRPDISSVMAQVEELLDRSVAAEAYEIPTGGEEQPMVNLSEIDFEALKEKFASTRKRTEAEKLRALISQRLQSMVSKNPSRADFLDRFQRLIDAYNAGSQNIEAFFAELVKLAQSLNEEDRRAIREGLTEEELALFDLLTKPGPDLTKKETAEVKKVCKALLETLKAEKLVLDWRSKPQARAAVRQAIEITLDKLPPTYDEAIYVKKCDAAYRHVYDSYYGGGESLYAL